MTFFGPSILHRFVLFGAKFGGRWCTLGYHVAGRESSR